MSGIAGIISLNKQVINSTELQEIKQLLRHRGPDAYGQFISPAAELLFLGFHTTKESHQEKSVLENEQFVLTADCRLDNRVKLITELHQSDGCTDMQLILSAYEKWGSSSPEHLLGDFAFAIWDKTKQELFCARDHMGVKPFYYIRDDDCFRFASELNALKRFSKSGQDQDMLNDYLLGIYNMNDPIKTIFRDIFKLPAGHRMFVAKGQLETEPYWQCPAVDFTSHYTSEEYINQFLQLFREAIECRLRSTQTIGSHLSGGIDSTSITVLAQDCSDQSNWPVFFIKSHLDIEDESQYVDAVLSKHKALNLHICSGRGPLSDIDKLVAIAAEPLHMTNAVYIWDLCQSAKSNNSLISLNGFFGDSLLDTQHLLYSHYLETGQYEKFNAAIIALAKALNIDVSVYLDYYAYPYLKGLAIEGKVNQFNRTINGLKKAFPMNRKQIWLQCWRQRPQGTFRRMYSKLRGREKRWLVEDYNVFASHIQNGSAQLIEKLKEHEHEQLRYNNVRLEKQMALSSDRCVNPLMMGDLYSAHTGIESRYPMLDKRLIEFAAKLPLELQSHHGLDRWIIREALKDLLPEKIYQRRRKITYNQTIDDQWVNDIQQHDLAKKLIKESSFNKSLKEWNADEFSQFFRYLNVELVK